MFSMHISLETSKTYAEDDARRRRLNELELVERAAKLTNFKKIEFNKFKQ